MVPGCPRRRRALDWFKRIALNHPNPEKTACCTSLNLTTTRSKAQIAAAMAAQERLAARKAFGSFGGTVQNQPAGAIS